jgi:succinoglycan biosynthesis protein ExoL
MTVAYFVHDLGEPGVHRRIGMLQAGGVLDLAVIGFRRSDGPAGAAGARVIDLGRTRDARLARRVGSVFRAAANAGQWWPIAKPTVVMARNLDMLAVASCARRRFAPGAPLVYECLDVHRAMTSSGAVGAALRALEGRLLRSCALLVVSSPAHVSEYFAKVHAALPATYLLENKVLAAEADRAALARRGHAGGDGGPPPGPPWRVGWFGAMRCRRSLLLLAELARRLPGRVEVAIRGLPSRTAIPDFEQIVADSPGLAFHGPYDRRKDLAAIYGQVHLAWAVDYHEAGANGDWALANRLYEASLYGAVPVSRRSAEMGRWLARRGIGILLDDPVDGSALARVFSDLDGSGYAAARAAVERVPPSDLVHSGEDSGAFVSALAELVGPGCRLT